MPSLAIKVLIALTGSEGSGEPAHARSLPRAFTARANDVRTLTDVQTKIKWSKTKEEAGHIRLKNCFS